MGRTSVWLVLLYREKCICSYSWKSWRKLCAQKDKEAIDKETLKRSVAKQRATGRTGYAAGGVVLGTGSALDWELDMTAQEETDLAIISYNADLERSSLQNQIGNYQNQAQGSRMAAKDSRNAAILGSGTSLLSSYTTYKTTF